MTVTLQHKDLTIKVFDDSAFSNNPDSPTKYDKIYQSESEKNYKPVSQTAIVVYKDNVKIASAILLVIAGATSVSKDSVLIDKDNLITRCCNTVFSLTIPDLKLNWQIVTDWATCFSIYKYQDTFITHGETSISRFDRNGKILWQQSGADIFVCIDEGTPFEMFDTHIALTDFNGSKYKIDYDGNTLSYDESDYYKQSSITVYLNTKKRWWKFW
jgi:hypothetical protein